MLKRGKGRGCTWKKAVPRQVAPATGRRLLSAIADGGWRAVAEPVKVLPSRRFASTKRTRIVLVSPDES